MDDIVLVIIGLLLLLAGGELLVRGSVAIAGRLGLSKLLIGVTVVGFGTSSPELVVSVTAALSGAPEIALGNVVGSNIANVLLILGVTALLYPVACQSFSIIRDSLFLVLVSIGAAGLVWSGYISQPVGFGMIALLCVYLAYSYYFERAKAQTAAGNGQAIDSSSKSTILIPILFCLAGFAALFFGAQWLIEGAVSVAKRIGISPSVIGLTMIAVGTSLPELATAAAAAFRKHSDIVIGNILGSSLFNILGILGATAAISPMATQGIIRDQDIWIMLGVAVLLLVIILWRKVVGVWAGLFFLICYAAYIIWRYSDSVLGSYI